MIPPNEAIQMLPHNTLNGKRALDTVLEVTFNFYRRFKRKQPPTIPGLVNHLSYFNTPHADQSNRETK